MKKKIAFTLAEVLITLSILGVVAAIAIPNIIQQYQKQATVSRLKMAYSMLDRLTQQSSIENGYPPFRDIDDNIFDTYFGKYLNIAKECGRGDVKPKAIGCFKRGNYKLYGQTENAKDENGNEKKRDMFYYLNGGQNSQGGYSPDYYYKVLLKNDMSIGILCNNCRYNGFEFVVDIDGPNRGDSKLGQDVFQFRYTSPSTINNRNCAQTGILISSFDAGQSCLPTRQYLLNKCKEDSSGIGCSGLIIMDGWKISSDYPWSYAHKK